jgi:hypothetical protein
VEKNIVTEYDPDELVPMIMRISKKSLKKLLFNNKREMIKIYCFHGKRLLEAHY